ncbi:MAG: M64 family metallopeptidase [Flavobacteriales bacterium]|nr:M64 family metallopeptidase [Flavobacteriales bacterium]
MRKYKIFSLLWVFAASIALFSCSKGEDPYLEITERTVTKTADATSATIEIKSNVEWTISGSSTWCSVSTVSGKGSATVGVTMSVNMGHEERASVFTIKSATLKEGSGVSVTVKQTGGPNYPPTLPTLLTPENGKEIATVLPKYTWTASTDQNEDPISYTLKVSKDQITWSSYNTRELTYTPNTKLEVGTKYYWKVMASDGAGSEVESAVSYFTVPNIVLHTEGEVNAFEMNVQADKNPINIIILGDGFIAEDLAIGGDFDKAAADATDAFFDIEPYRSHRNKFNIYFVYSESKERGGIYGHGYDGSHQADYLTFAPKTSFSSIFSTTKNSTGISCDYEKCFKYARKVPNMNVGADVAETESGAWIGAISDKTNPINNCVIILIINDKRYAGTCVFWGTGACIGMCPRSNLYEPTLRHEVGGHGFAKLGDEYQYASTPAMTQSEIANFHAWENIGAYQNLSLTNDASTVKWLSFITDSTFPEVGLYEGGNLRLTNVWRPEYISCMWDNRSYFNGPSRYAILSRIMKLSTGNVANDNYVFPFADFKAIDKKDPNVSNGLTKAGQKLPPLAPPIMIMNN